MNLASGRTRFQHHSLFANHVFNALRAASLGLLGIVSVWPANSVCGQDLQPNIVVIMADDLGFGDVSCYGAKRIQTPSIDRLASEGIRFTSGYCSASTCTPTRYSFLTGEYAFRRPNTGIAPPNSPAIISPDAVTLPGVLREAGYRTGVIGKWHLGLGESEGPDWNGELKPGPLEIGFDSCFLLPTTNDRVPQVFVRDRRVEGLSQSDPLWVGSKKPSADHPDGQSHRATLRLDWSHGHHDSIHNGISRIGFYTGGMTARFRDEDLADRWVAEARQFMQLEPERPFFLFFSSHDVHVPRMPHERFQGTTELGLRGDSIAELDWSVGQIHSAVNDLPGDRPTFIVFCSDNGPVLDDGYQDEAVEQNGDHRSAGPFTGGKYSVYEGGTRTPFIAWWPDKLKPMVSEEMVCTIDLPASLAKIVGAEIPSHAFPDSFDVSDALIGLASATGRPHLVQQDNGRHGNFGFRRGQWKLLVHKNQKAFNNVVEAHLANTKVPHYQLFDLSKDPSESSDVSKEYPDIVASMRKELETIIDSGRSRPL